LACVELHTIICIIGEGLWQNTKNKFSNDTKPWYYRRHWGTLGV